MTHEFPQTDAHGRSRTAYAVYCRGTDVGIGITEQHGLVYLTDSEYDRQMMAADYGWRCPLCNSDASWSDDNFEQVEEASHD